jgi:Ca-activated chloride channel homolog
MPTTQPSRPACPAGLITDADHHLVPLEHVHVEARVIDLCARVTVHQRYRNHETVPVEAVYVFPLDEGAAVCGFTATVGGVRYAGRVLARDEAFREYDDALEAGHGAFLLDEERADIFTASVGNLAPGATAELEITYVTELAAEGPDVRFSLPTTVAPRYAPEQDRTGISPTPAELLNPPVALDVSYGFSFEMDVTMAQPIRQVRSATHAIEVEPDGCHARVRLATREAAMDRDLVITVAADGLDAPHATVERGERGQTLLVSFVPRFEAEIVPPDVTFVIDRSGSMDGSSIAEVRNALQLCLRSLRPGSHFNIVSFGSTFSALFPGSRAYDDRSLAEASAFVSTLEADMGGTELLPAMQAVLEGQDPAPGRARQILLMTDGEITNTDEVIALVRRHARTVRCFTFGIGAGASQHLVRGVARASGGAAEFISLGERIEAKVMRQFSRLFAPALLDTRVALNGATAVVANDPLAAAFTGERFTVYAMADTLAGGTVTLGGTIAGRDVSFTIPIDPARAIAGTTIATLAARTRIRSLEERPEFLESRGSRQRRPRRDDAVAEIVALGVRYQLASRETSFVAVEHRDTPSTEPATLRRIPVALTSGLGGAARPVMAFSLATPTPMVPAGHGPLLSRRSQRAPRQACFSMAFDPSPLAAPPASSSLRPVDHIVALQHADGSWALDPALAKAVGLTLEVIERQFARMTSGRLFDRDAAATALALGWLERHAAAEREEWMLLADKARAWFGMRHMSGDERVEYLAEAETLLG